MLYFRMQGQSINQAACDIAREVAAEGGALIAGGICQTPSYLSGLGKAAVQSEFRKQVKVFIDNRVDFLICEVRGFLIVWFVRNFMSRSSPLLFTCLCVVRLTLAMAPDWSELFTYAPDRNRIKPVPSEKTHRLRQYID
jgi:hypothetical protein